VLICKKNVFVGTKEIFVGTNTKEMFEMPLFLVIYTDISNISYHFSFVFAGTPYRRVRWQKPWV